MNFATDLSSEIHVAGEFQIERAPQALREFPVGMKSPIPTVGLEEQLQHPTSAHVEMLIDNDRNSGDVITRYELFRRG